MSRFASARVLAALLFVLVAAAAIAATASGRRGRAHPKAHAAATSCFSTFTFHPGQPDEFIVCVTRNGNVVRYQTPQGIENLAGSTFGEGCTASTRALSGVTTEAITGRAPWRSHRRRR